MSKRVLFVGMGRAGKDTACEIFSEITGLKNAGTTSKYLSAYMAEKLNLPVEEAYRRRHESNEMRDQWYRGGNELRQRGLSTLVKIALENGPITGGVRGLDEIEAVRAEGLVDLIVWVQNDRVPADPTVKFTSAQADVVIENNGTLEEFREKLVRLARFAQLGKDFNPKISDNLRRERIEGYPSRYDHAISDAQRREWEAADELAIMEGRGGY